MTVTTETVLEASCIEVRGAAKHLTLSRIASTPKNYLPPMTVVPRLRNPDVEEGLPRLGMMRIQALSHVNVILVHALAVGSKGQEAYFYPLQRNFLIKDTR